MENELPEGEEKKIVHATINGLAIEAEENETILHCARRNGIYIPTLCELDDIDHTPGTCRVCLVEFQLPGAAAPKLTLSRTGPTSLTLSWTPTGGTLYSSPALGQAANWQAVANPTNPMSIQSTNKAAYYRIK